ncbi:MAG: alpha/beta hydrolase [Candidatus Limnocylindrales bacterium]
MLLIHAGAEDAEEWRPVAERLRDFTTVTYDRRGTLRSGRDNWPGEGSAQHADDAAGLLRGLGLDDGLVFGGSSGGNIALQLALRHPGLVRRALVWEPGHLRQVPDGQEVYRRMRNAGFEHLAAHPDDWAGAYAAVLRSLALMPDQPPGAPAAATHARSWYDEREEGNAEALMLDDIPILTGELIDEADLASAAVDIRFAFGTRTAPIFREVTLHLAAVRDTTPDIVRKAGHVILYQPDAAAAYIRGQSGA